MENGVIESQLRTKSVPELKNKVWRLYLSEKAQLPQILLQLIRVSEMKRIDSQ
jgi:hypothetical protein